MKRNMGNLDRVIRIVIALAIGGLYYMNIITGTWTLVLLAVAVIFVLTGFVSFCPLYALFGIRTCAVKK